MGTLTDILNRAQARASEADLPYAGAVTPSEAYALLQSAPGTTLVDVRTRAEWDWVGRIPGAVEIEWIGYPGGQPATTDGHEHGMDRPRVLAQDFHADGALAGDHVRIVKRRNIGCTSGFGQFDRMQIGVAERVAVQHDPGTA